MQSKRVGHLTSYDLSQEYQALILIAEDECDEETLSQLFTDLSGSIDAKLDGIAAVIRELAADEAKLSAEVDRLTARKKTLQNNIRVIKERTVWLMQSVGLTKQKTLLNSFALVETAGSLSVVDEDQIPDKYKITKTVTQVLNAELKEALKNGEQIAGAEIIKLTSLRIR